MLRLLAVLLLASSALAQPYSQPPKPPEYTIADVDGNGVPNANDFQQFQSKFGIARAWYDDWASNAPGQARSLAGSAVGQTVSLTWANDNRPQTAVYVLRNGSVVQTLAGTATSASDQPGGGTWTYSIATGNKVGVFNYPPIAGSIPATQVVVQGAPPISGWTDLSLPAGAVAVYVSSSTGSDANAGSQAAPLRSISAGYAKLRDGQPDQLVLKCGDTFNETVAFRKSAGSDTAYMVLGSYGTGARPIVNCGGNIGVYLDHNRKGVAIVGIKFKGTSGSGYTGITGFSPASHILVEDCEFDNVPTGIVFQETSQADRLRDVKIRRNVFHDIVDTGAGHSQGIFIGNTDDLVVEGNVYYKIALNKADIFCHANYLSETDGTSIFIDNIMAMACSHGVQQRSGGTMKGNLSLRNPINFFQGNSTGGGGSVPVNYFGFNVALDSRNINSIDRRGFGAALEGADGSVCEGNVIAFQSTGTDAIDGLDISGGKWTIRNTVVWDWDGPNAGNPGWATAVHIESGATIQTMTGCTLVHHGNGMLIRWERPVTGTYTGNTYWTATPDGGVGGYQRFSTNAGVGATLAQWRAATGDQSTFLASAPPQIAATIGDYLQSIGITPGSDPVDTFMLRACQQSKQAWDDRFTAPVVNAWVRSKFGVASPV